MNLRAAGVVLAGGALVLSVACGSSNEAGGGSDDAGTAGGSSSGGTSGSSGGPSACGGSAADPAAATTLSSYMDKLSPNALTPAGRAQIVDTILKTCEVFGPPAAKDPGWDRTFCWAHLASAINKESTYNAASKVTDSYATRTTAAGKANDPTVGLLQIRFSSVVNEFTELGPTGGLACIGCTLPPELAAHKGEPGDSAFWSVTGPTQNMATLTDVACNIGMGAWYYYVNSTSNGRPSAPTYVAEYCTGKGTAGNLITGLLSHLGGPNGGKGVIPDMAGVEALQGTNANAYKYVTLIKTMFDSMVGPVSGTHPFFLTQQPNSTQYCR